MPDIVVAYRGLAVGDRVPTGVAKHKTHATGCWAGTDKTSITLRVRVEHFPSAGIPPPTKGFSIRPYFVKTRAHYPPFTRTFHGQIGNQDAYFRRL